MEPIRILHEDVIMNPGGIETQLMRIYRNIDRTKVQFDFLLHRKEEGEFDKEIVSLGGRIFRAEPFNPFHHVKYVNSMKSFFHENPYYKIMLAHAELALWPLIVAKQANIPVRICYSHNGQSSLNLKRLFMDTERLMLKKYCTDMFAVSELAGRYTFGDKAVDSKQVVLIKNGIYVDDFIFNNDIRLKKREELGLQDKFVVGHVGRFMQQKNHLFLIDVFDKICKQMNNAHLILVGEGELETQVRDYVKEKKIDSKVSFLGRRNDVNDLMKAMDVLLLPSLWEGFPNVAIEAQASALPVYMSENITSEADFTCYSHRLPLGLGSEYWADVVYSDSNRCIPRINMAQEMKNQGYDVIATAKWYENYYLDKYESLKYNT